MSQQPAQPPSPPTADARPARSIKRRRVILLVVLAVGAVAAAPWSWNAYHIHAARQSLHQRKYDEAMLSLDRAAMLPPSTGEIAFLRARCHRMLGEYSEMSKQLKLAHEAEFHLERLKREQWLAAAQIGRMSEAEPHFQRMLNDPLGDGVAICEAFAGGYFLKNEIFKGFEVLTAWESEFPDDAQPHVFRALYAHLMGNIAEEVMFYERALNLAPWRNDVRLGLAKALLKVHKYDEALAHLDNVESENRAEVSAIRGDCMSALAQPQEARKFYRDAIEIDPQHLEAQEGLGRLELETGHPEKAVKWLLPLAEEHPHRLQLRYSLAAALRKLDRDDEAQGHLEFADKARAAIEKINKLIDVVQQQPKDIKTRFEIGRMLLSYGPPTQALGWLHSVLEYEPYHTETHRLLADYYEQKGNRELAARHRRRGGGSRD